jgi:5-methylcytosine-specific restriction protein A
MKPKRPKIATLKPAVRLLAPPVENVQSRGSVLGLAAKRFYHSAQWLKTRAAKLRRDPLCQRCKYLGQATPALHVDHRLALAQGGHRTADENLVSLCASHHSEKTRAELDGLPLPEIAPSTPRDSNMA